MVVYVHQGNHKAYQKCGQSTMIQIDNLWVPAVLYYSMEEPQKYFVRSQEEFEEKFMMVEIPTPTTRRYTPPRI